DVRICELAAGVAQAVVGRRVRTLAVEGRLERDALRDEPVIVRDAVVAVEAYLRLVRPRPAGRHEVLEHLLRRVLEAACLLDRRPAAEVDLTRREGRGAAAPARALEHQHLGARGRRLDRRAGPGRAEA